MRRERRLKLERLEERTLLATLQGSVFEDADGNHAYQEFVETKIPGWTVFLDLNQNGELDGERVEPDEFPFFDNLNVVNAHVTLLQVDGNNQPRAFADVKPTADANRSTGNLVLGGTWDTNRRLRADFTNAVSWVAIDAIGNNITGKLEVYNSNDQLLTSFETPPLNGVGYEQMFISRPTDDIAYAVAYSAGNLLRLDNLRFGSSALGEPTAKTNFTGSYSFSNVNAGTYDVAAIDRNDWFRTTPTAPDVNTVTVTAGETVGGFDFGFATLNSQRSISGVVYHDYNAEGVTKERFEQGVQDRRIFADLNSNGIFDGTEPTTLTNEWGEYNLRVFGTGLFNVAMVAPTGWSQTFPLNNVSRAVLVNGVDTIVDMNFGSRRNNVPLTPGNILVSRSSWVTTDMLLELNRDGEILQGISIPGTADFSRTRVQDLAVDSNGNVQIIVHSDSGNYLQTYDHQSGAFSTLNIPEWDTMFIEENDDQIAVFGDFLFVTDHSLSNNASGIIRIDTTDMSWQRFSDGVNNPYEIAVGQDGLLYAMETGANNSVVNVFEPNSMQFFRQILLPPGQSFMEVDAISHSYTPSHRDANGVQLDSSPLGILFGSLDLGQNGDLLFSGGVFGDIGIVNKSFHPNTRVFFETFIDSSNGGETYAVFNELPTTGPLTVESVVVNGGLTDPSDLPSAGAQPTSWLEQKSSIRTIIVTLTEPVVAIASDIVLVNLGVDAPNEADFAVPLDPSQVSVAGNEITLNFGKDELPEGSYSLILLNSVTDLNGGAIDGNGDGTRGDAFIHRGSEENGFYRFIADWNGDVGTSVFDFSTFSYWFGQAVPVAPDYADLNDDGGVSVFDFNDFATNFGLGVTFEVAFAAVTITRQNAIDVAEESKAAQVDEISLATLHAAQRESERKFSERRSIRQKSPNSSSTLPINDVALDEFLAELIDDLWFS